MNLVIVESPAKAGTISKFLGKDFEVLASMGHLRDMPKSKLGVDIENNFNIEYINVRGKAALINKLKNEAKKADKIYLATDPDREGEAISYHLSILLNIKEKDINRVTFNEITKEVVKSGINNPRVIDMNLVDAQQARRVIDRLVGYKISPILWKKIKSGLSAGRVQSVALRLIIDRENEINNFKKEEYWDFLVKVKSKDKSIFDITYFSKEKISSIGELKKIEEKLQTKYKLIDIKNSKKKQSPPPPFTTSTMQIASSNKLGFTIKKTMQVAQKLYEGVKIEKKGLTGLITYMRTDSTRISEVARKSAKEVISKEYGENYFENRYYKAKKDIQDAHEAIRPTYPELTPNSIKNSLSVDEYKLYNLIYNRFLASLFKDAVYSTRVYDFLNSDYVFKYNASILEFEGFKKVYDIESEENIVKKFPQVNIGEEVDFVEYIEKQKFTEPKSRYTEASLVKVLEENEIGRPSTYAPTINTLFERLYVLKEKKFLKPTDLGKNVDKLLRDNFTKIIDIPFTAKVEEKLDLIAQGKLYFKKLIEDFYNELKQELDNAQNIEKIVIQDEKSDELCEKCGKNLVYKMGKFGKFLACSGFPDCKFTKTIKVIIKEKCPKCNGDVEQKKSKKGKFYLCTNKDCDYISWKKPQSDSKINVKRKTSKEPKKVIKKATKKVTKPKAKEKKEE